MQATFPEGQFRVKIHKYSLGENIQVYTDLIKDTYDSAMNDLKWRFEVAHKALTPEEWQALKDYEKRQEENNKMKDAVKNLVNDFEHIDRDSITGEILSGGNTYMDVSPL